MTRGLPGERGHAIAGTFVFLLLGVFAVFSTMLVLVGAQAYRALTEASERHNAGRILHAYVQNAVRADDALGAVEIADEGGVTALRVRYDYDGDVYLKRVYCYDGALRELFVSEDYEFDPSEGEPICAARAMEAELDGGLLTVTLTGEDGEAVPAQIALRAAEG